MSRRREQDIENSSEEAKQEQERVQDSNPQPISEEEEGQDLLENQQIDYKPIEALDHYQNEGIDDDEIYDQDYDARRKAQKQMNRRHKTQLYQGDDVDDLIQEDDIEEEKQMMERRRLIEAEEEDEEIDERRYLDAEQNKGKLPQWIKQEQTRKYIKIKFTKFLTQFKATEDFPIYAVKIKKMVIDNLKSIEISFDHLKIALPTIAMWVGLHPSLILPELNLIAYSIACKNYPSFKLMNAEVYVKIVDLPFVDHIRDLRHTHLGKLVKIKGVITIRSQTFSQLKKITYKCVKCGELKGPFYINNVNDTKLGQCTSCQSAGPFLIEKNKTIYRDYQRITVQESPSDVLPGRIPRSKEAIMYGDNIDVGRPGDEVEITGIFINRYESYVNVKQGFPLFTTYIEVNHMVKGMETEVKNYDMIKQEQFRKMAEDKNLSEKIYGSIAPSIYGHENIKQALTLAMFGGEPIEGTHRVRGDINVLLLGDPGVAKSQFLKSIQKVFHRCIYTTGKGASAVGLTASVKKDFNTNQWKLQAGALVLADKGICLIDEFDKMNQHDRTSIHEAMEQQSISISKAGIVTSLRARCSVIAAANPIQGRYNSQLSFADNADLSEPILSRFDVISVIKDEVNEEIDNDLSTFVINSHIQNHPYQQKYDLQLRKLQETREVLPYIKHDILKHYIRYARQKCHPQLTEKNHAIIKQFFTELRKVSRVNSGMNVTIRQIEAIIRLSQAHAKMHLRNEVQKQDVEVGIRVLLQSFIQTLKHSTAKIVRKQMANYLMY